jgi:hypothetical protein
MKKLQKTSTDQHGVAFIGSLISLIAGIIGALLALRFIFRLLGANPNNGFVEWVYATSKPLVAPFYGIFNHDINVVTGKFELETLVALIVYGIVAAIVISLVSWPARRRDVV